MELAVRIGLLPGLTGPDSRVISSMAVVFWGITITENDISIIPAIELTGVKRIYAPVVVIFCNSAV